MRPGSRTAHNAGGSKGGLTPTMDVGVCPLLRDAAKRLIESNNPGTDSRHRGKLDCSPLPTMVSDTRARSASRRSGFSLTGLPQRPRPSSIRAYLPSALSRTAKASPFPNTHRQPGPS